MKLSQAVTAVFTIVKTDELKTAIPALAAFITNIALDPSGLNRIAQLAKLQADLIAAQPAIEIDALKEIATLIMGEMPATAAQS